MVSSNQNGVNGLAKVFTPVIDVQTYKNALYLLLAFPLRFIYWMILGFGFIFGIGLSIARSFCLSLRSGERNV